MCIRDRYNINVVTAESGKEAIQIINDDKQKVDMVLMLSLIHIWSFRRLGCRSKKMCIGLLLSVCCENTLLSGRPQAPHLQNFDKMCR